MCVVVVVVVVVGGVCIDPLMFSYWQLLSIMGSLKHCTHIFAAVMDEMASVLCQKISKDIA